MSRRKTIDFGRPAHRGAYNIVWDAFVILGKKAFTIIDQPLHAMQLEFFDFGAGRAAVSTVVDNTGPFASFHESSLNDFGDVAFTADLDELSPDGIQIQGVFTGNDAKRDVVLQTGDKYDGERMTSVTTCSESLNNRREIVMTVQSQDPMTFEVRTFRQSETEKLPSGNLQ